jgi:GNAT superfamily N-acetyltransferase
VGGDRQGLGMQGWHIRDAAPGDLESAFDIFYENEMRGEASPPPRGLVPAYLRHVLATGRVLVAEQEGRLLGFAGLITRGEVSFLTDLFVRPSMQSSSIGKMLLHQILPTEGVRWTCGSSDPRALSLYVRAGMRPQWPQFWLRAIDLEPERLPEDSLTIVEATPGDPELLAWDAEIGGRYRPEDHAFSVRDQQAVALWFLRQGERVGYGYVRLAAGTIRYPGAVTVGPVGTRRADDAAASVLAATRWACQRARVLHITVPGPHPSLAPLLEAGCRIIDLDTFLASSPTPYLDPRRYLSSGGDMF